MLFQLKFDDEIVQNFRNMGETVRYTQQGIDQKTSARPKRRKVVLKRGLLNLGRQHNQRIHSQCCRHQNTVNSNVELALGPEKKVDTSVGQGKCSFQRGQHPKPPEQRVSSHTKMRTRSPRGMEEPVHLRASANPVSSAVLSRLHLRTPDGQHRT